MTNLLDDVTGVRERRSSNDKTQFMERTALGKYTRHINCCTNIYPQRYEIHILNRTLWDLNGDGMVNF